MTSKYLFKIYIDTIQNFNGFSGNFLLLPHFPLSRLVQTQYGLDS